jgi:hypothetical protein
MTRMFRFSEKYRNFGKALDACARVPAIAGILAALALWFKAFAFVLGMASGVPLSTVEGLWRICPPAWLTIHLVFAIAVVTLPALLWLSVRAPWA